MPRLRPLIGDGTEHSSEISRQADSCEKKWPGAFLTPYGGTLTPSGLKLEIEKGPPSIAISTKERWAYTDGDRISWRPLKTSYLGFEAELIHAESEEDARSADDFLLRRTKQYFQIPPKGREAVKAWFGS